MESEEERSELTIDETRRSSQSSDGEEEEKKGVHDSGDEAKNISAKFPSDSNDSSKFQSATKGSDTRAQDFQLLRKYENAGEKASPFVSSELDEFLINLNKERPNINNNNNNGVLRQANERSRSASSESKDSSSLRMRQPSPDTLHPRSSAETSAARDAYSTSAAASLARPTPSFDSVRKRHANLPAVIQKYMRMSKKTAVGDSLTTPNESQSVAVTADHAEPASRIAASLSTRNPNDKRPRRRGRPPRLSATRVEDAGVKPSRTPSPACSSTLSSDTEETEASCARTAFLFPVSKSSPSSERLLTVDSSSSLTTVSTTSKMTSSSKELPEPNIKASSPRSSPAKSYVFRSLLNSHELGAHGDLVFVRRPVAADSGSNSTSGTKDNCPAKLLHIHADEAGWKAEKHGIVGAIMRTEQRLTSVPACVTFQQRGWNVVVRPYDSSKEKPFRVSCSLRTLPRSLDEAEVDDEDDNRDVEVVFVRIASMGSMEDATQEKQSEENPSEPFEAGIAIVETRSLSQDGLRPSEREEGSLGVERENESDDEARWCRRRSIATQVVTIRHADSEAVFRGGQRYALRELGIHPCDPIAEVEEIMSKKDAGMAEVVVDRTVQVAVNLELVNCEKAETHEKLVSLMGTTADPIPTSLPPPVTLDPPIYMPVRRPPSKEQPQPVTMPQPRPLAPQQPKLPIPRQPPPQPPPRPQLMPPLSPRDVSAVLPKSSSPEILLVNTADDRDGTAPATKSTILPHVVADLASSTVASMTQNSNLTNMLVNNPGSTVLPVQILPQGLIKLPPGAKVVYNNSTTPNSMPCIVNSVGTLKTIRTPIPSTSSLGVRPQSQVRVPLFFPQQGKRILYLPSPSVPQTGSYPVLRQQLKISTPTPQPRPSPSLLRQYAPLPSPLRQLVAYQPPSTSHSSSAQRLPQILRLPFGVSLNLSVPPKGSPPIQTQSPIQSANDGGSVAEATMRSSVVVAPLRPSTMLSTTPVPISLVTKGQMTLVSASTMTATTEPLQPTVQSVCSLVVSSANTGTSLDAVKMVAASSVTSPSSASPIASELRIESVVGGLQKENCEGTLPSASECDGVDSFGESTVTSVPELGSESTTFSGEKDDPVILI